MAGARDVRVLLGDLLQPLDQAVDADFALQAERALDLLHHRHDVARVGALAGRRNVCAAAAEVPQGVQLGQLLGAGQVARLGR